MHSLLEKIARDFSVYTEGFFKDPKLQEQVLMKYLHSYRVLAHGLEIADSLRVNSDTRELCGIASLLHDIGRFLQVERTGSASDAPESDHGSFGIEALDYIGSLWQLPNRWQECIKTVTRLHNKKEVPKGLGETITLVLNLVRDADKLDILHNIRMHVQAKAYDVIWEGVEVRGPLAPNIINSYCQGKGVLLKDVKSLADISVLQLSFFEGLAFNHSKECFVKAGHFERLRDQLEDLDTDGASKVLPIAERRICGFKI